MNWSSYKSQMSKTEKELKEYIANNLEHLMACKFKEICVEAQIPLGIIDILAADHNDVKYVIEVKRKTINMNTIYQLQRYIDYFKEIEAPSIGYVAGPSISKNAYSQLIKKGFNYLNMSKYSDSNQQ